MWGFPGGRLHSEEDPKEGLAREVLEETGLQVAVGEPLFVCKSYHYKDKQNQLFIVWKCVSDSDEVRFDPSEIEEVRWADKDELHSLPMFGGYREAIEAYFNR